SKEAAVLLPWLSPSRDQRWKGVLREVLELLPARTCLVLLWPSRSSFNLPNSGVTAHIEPQVFLSAAPVIRHFGVVRVVFFPSLAVPCFSAMSSETERSPALSGTKAVSRLVNLYMLVLAHLFSLTSHTKSNIAQKIMKQILLESSE
ncbi:hypothetical protein EJB05_22392, partial [Eragrostis curvula]